MKALLLIPVLFLSACASSPSSDAPPIPPEAEEITRTEANGDVITEYRVNGQLRIVRVQPSRGVEYFLHDRDGDGIVDHPGGDVPQVYFRLFEW